MNLYVAPGMKSTANLTLQPGRRPVQNMETNKMVLMNHSILLDLANATQRERINQSIRRSMVDEAVKAGSPRIGIVRSIRRFFGDALIGVGNRVHGDRAGVDSAVLTTSDSLGLAR